MMQGQLIHDQIGNRQLIIYLPPDYETSKEGFPVIYAQDGKQVEKLLPNIISEMESKFSEHGYQSFILIGIYSDERIHEYTPWPAPALGDRFEAFKGQGDAYLLFIEKELMPYIHARYKVLKEARDTAIMGYSLGGLLSMYSAYKTIAFGKIAAISGSFWYKDMVDYIETHELLNKEVKIFMSYGSEEGHKKENIQKQAVPCAQKVSHLLQEKITYKEDFACYTDDGGHHEYANVRYQRALEWLSKSFNK